MSATETERGQTTCILCECNCGVEVELGTPWHKHVPARIESIDD